MSDHDPPTEIENFHCVDEHRRIEQPDGYVTHHVVFYDELEHLYGQLLQAIRDNGYEVVHMEPDDERIMATFVETDDAFDFGDHVWGTEEKEYWIDDIPK